LFFTCTYIKERNGICQNNINQYNPMYTLYVTKNKPKLNKFIHYMHIKVRGWSLRLNTLQY
jgi:oligoribonuclease (3'-5' exoribonuclease)